MVGKDVLGIIALENALHPLFTSLGAALPKTYKHQTWDNDNKVYKELEDVDYKMRLLLNHNKTKDGRISLSGINSVDGKDKIADLFSHLMNGAVDVEKDAWIFFIQANKEIVPVLLSLLKAGVPKREAVYFVSQPLVKEYARQQRLVKSAYAGITENGVDSPSFIKYKALQNTLAQTGLSNNSKLIKEASRLKMFEALKTATDKITVQFRNGDTKEGLPKSLIDSIKAGRIKQSDILSVKYTNPKYILDENGKPKEDDYGNKKTIPLYTAVNKNHLLSNDNWYYVTQVATEGINQFTEDDLSKNINNNDKFSPSAIAAFLHFLEFEREIKGISNLKRQANPDTKTSKTIQEILQKVVSLEEAADSSKIEPELAERLLKESILGTFFDKDIVNDVVSPLFDVTNNKTVSNFMLDAIKTRGGSITSKFGPGRDGVQAFISSYKNAIINYIYQNKLYDVVNSEEGYPGIPESFNNLDAEEFVDDFMFILSKHNNLKERFPILEQLTDVTIKNRESGVTTKTITLNNKNAVKGELAEAYYQNLIDLADDNVIKVKDPVENQVISDTFKVLPLMSIYQNGVGNTKYGLSYVLPDDVYFSLLEPSSREFLENNLNDKTLTEIANLLFANDFGQNNYLKSSYTGPRKQSSKGDTQYDSEENLPLGNVSENEQTITFGTQPSTQQQVNTSDDTKTPREGLNERLDNYGYARIVLSSDFNEGARPKGRLNAFKEAIRLAAQNPTALMDINLNEFDFITNDEKKRLDDLRPLAEEFQKNNLLISGAEFRTVAVEKRFAQLTNQLTNEFVDIVGKHVEQQLGKTISSSKPRIITQQQAPVSEVKEGVQSDNTVTYKPIGKETQTYTVKGGSIFNKNGDEVFKEASSDRNKIFANLAVKQGRAVIVEYKTYTNKEGVDVPAKYVVNNKDVIISVRTGDIMKWPETSGDRKAIIALAKAAFSEATSEEPEIDKNMEAFNAEVAKLGRMPKEFIVGPSKWVLNNMNLYDLVDKTTDSIFMKNMNMFTGKIVEETALDTPVNQKQLYNFTKQLASGVKEYKLDNLLALKGISIDDIYDDISNNRITTQRQLNNKINEILKAIC
jgi:hypothetical protein